MSKLKNILYLSIYGFIICLSVYIQYEGLLNKIYIEPIKIGIFLVICLSYLVSCFFITFLLAQMKKFEIDMMYICCIIMGFLIYIFATICGIATIIEYGKDYKILKSIGIVIGNTFSTIMLYRRIKKEVI